MAHELGPALRASCAFVSRVELAHRVLPLIEDWPAATRTREVCRHSDTGRRECTAATQSRPERPENCFHLCALALERRRNHGALCRDVYDRARPGPQLNGANVIDRLRAQIQERLDQLAGEADRLRKALAALDPRSSKTPAPKPPVRKPAQRTASKPTASATQTAPARRTSQPAARSGRRTAPGATKASVLAALAGGEAMTAGQVADKTGLARGTVSTTLSKLAKSGEVQKAERGYRFAATPSPPAE